MTIFLKNLLIILMSFTLGLSESLLASDIESKPFVEKKITLQISDKDIYKQKMVLNVASNLIKHYGTDQVEIEIVAFGPGVALLFKGNTNSNRIDNLAKFDGIRFSICNNTLASIKAKNGKEPELNKHAKRVKAGVVRIIELEEAGYMLIKP